MCHRCFFKCFWVKPLKGKKGETFLNVFIEMVNESTHIPNKLWIDHVREFDNNLMQEWLDNNGI